MGTEAPGRVRGREGFTLIEIMVAMIILSGGLLALEALGISAARAVANADRNSELTVGATGAMEEAMQAIRSNPSSPPTGQSCGTNATSGLYVCTTVDTRTTSATLTPHTAHVTVTVSRSASSDEQLTISSYAFNPQLPG